MPSAQCRSEAGCLQARAKESGRNELKRIVSDTLQQLTEQQQAEQVFVYTPGLCGNHTEQRYDWSLMPEVHRTASCTMLTAGTGRRPGWEGWGLRHASRAGTTETVGQRAEGVW